MLGVLIVSRTLFEAMHMLVSEIFDKNHAQPLGSVPKSRCPCAVQTYRPAAPSTRSKPIKAVKPVKPQKPRKPVASTKPKPPVSSVSHKLT